MINNNILEDRLISDLGYDFSDIAKIEFPEKAITELLAYMGKLFGCERVYIFEKNEEGAYDCTDEWIRDQTYAKKDLSSLTVELSSAQHCKSVNVQFERIEKAACGLLFHLSRCTVFKSSARARLCLGKCKRRKG